MIVSIALTPGCLVTWKRALVASCDGVGLSVGQV